MNKTEFKIGIIGVSPISPTLQEYLAAKNKISNKQYKVIRYNSIDQAENCQVLYIAKDQLPYHDQIIAKLAGKPTLIITEVPGLIKRGSCINLLSFEGSSVKIQLNKSAFQAHKLTYTPDLLKLANETF